MPRRQLLVFKIGCLAALLAALVHLAGYLSGPPPPANDTERELMRLATTYRFPLPGGTSRALMDLLDGFSLMFAVFLSLTGGIGYIVQKRGRHDGVLMTALARTLAAGYTVLLVISLMQFFIIPTIFIALVTVCFAIASVGAPRQA